jgi:hypothetical protein
MSRTGANALETAAETANPTLRHDGQEVRVPRSTRMYESGRTYEVQGSTSDAGGGDAVSGCPCR